LLLLLRGAGPPLLLACQLSQQLCQVVQGVQQLEAVEAYPTLAGLRQRQDLPIGCHSLLLLL
jgi:hypothetical protein